MLPAYCVMVMAVVVTEVVATVAVKDRAGWMCSDLINCPPT